MKCRDLRVGDVERHGNSHLLATDSQEHLVPLVEKTDVGKSGSNRLLLTVRGGEVNRLATVEDDVDCLYGLGVPATGLG